MFSFFSNDLEWKMTKNNFMAVVLHTHAHMHIYKIMQIIFLFYLRNCTQPPSPLPTLNNFVLKYLHMSVISF